jgi:hypothetical protein
VTYMFETKEGAEDMSPFALAVNMVMAIGTVACLSFCAIARSRQLTINGGGDGDFSRCAHSGPYGSGQGVLHASACDRLHLLRRDRLQRS